MRLRPRVVVTANPGNKSKVEITFTMFKNPPVDMKKLFKMKLYYRSKEVA